MRVDVVSLFPEFIAQCAGFGVVGRAQERKLLCLHGWNPRDYADGNYRRVDDRPFGGGPGMVMMIEPLQACLAAARAADPTPAHVIYLTPQGQRLTQPKVRALAARPRLVLLCGRYEGVDERLVAGAVDEERRSLGFRGSYVLGVWGAHRHWSAKADPTYVWTSISCWSVWRGTAEPLASAVAPNAIHHFILWFDDTVRRIL